MKVRLTPFVGLASLLLLVALPASAQILYENGPINGETDAWMINFGFVVENSFTMSTGPSQVTGVSFGAWLPGGDVLDSAYVLISSEAYGGTVYFGQQVNFVQSGCFINNYGYDVCTETSTFSGPTLNNGSYQLTLGLAVVNDGDPVYWDENSGVGCQSPGCPSQASQLSVGSIPSESFSVLGTASGTGSVPEPGSLLLFGSGLIGSLGFLRRKFF